MPTRLRGVVLSSDGKTPQSGVDMEAYDPATAFTQGSDTTDLRGEFILSGLENRAWIPRRASGSGNILILLTTETSVVEDVHGQKAMSSAHAYSHLRNIPTRFPVNVQDEGVDVFESEILNFTGAGVSAAYDAGNSRVDVTVSGGGGGEANTASNIGTGGVGVFDAKVGVDLQFRNINAGSAKLTVTDDAANDEIDIDLGSVALADLSDVTGTSGTGTTVLLQGSPTISSPAINGTVTTTGLTMPALTQSGDVLFSGSTELNFSSTTRRIVASGTSGLIMEAGTQGLLYTISAATKAALTSSSFALQTGVALSVESTSTLKGDVTIGSGSGTPALNFDSTSDAALTWNPTPSYLSMPDLLVLGTNKKINIGSTSTYIQEVVGNLFLIGGTAALLGGGGVASLTASASGLSAGADLDMNDNYVDIAQIVTPANPGATDRRIFNNSATGKLSVRTNAGSTVSLEEEGDVASTRLISTTEGIQGGGDLSADRTHKLDIGSLTADASPDGAADYVVTLDATDSTHKKVLLNNLPGGGGGGAPTSAQYVVMSLDATLTAERVLTAGTGLDLTDGGANGNATLDLNITGLTDYLSSDTLQKTLDQLLLYDASAAAHKKITPSEFFDDMSANDLGDFDGTGASANDLLKWSGTAWIDFDLFGGDNLLWDGKNRYGDSTGTVSSGTGGRIAFGAGDDAGLRWYTGGTNQHLQLSVTATGAASGGGYVSLVEDSDSDNTNRRPASAASNPTLRIYSSDALQANDYLELSHDQTDAVLNWGNGDFSIQNLGTEVFALTSGGNLTLGSNAAADVTITLDAAVADCVIKMTQSTANLDINRSVLLSVSGPALYLQDTNAYLSRSTNQVRLNSADDISFRSGGSEVANLNTRGDFDCTGSCRGEILIADSAGVAPAGTLGFQYGSRSPSKLGAPPTWPNLPAGFSTTPTWAKCSFNGVQGIFPIFT